MAKYTVHLSAHLELPDPEVARAVRKAFDRVIQKHLQYVSSYELRGYNYADGKQTASAPAAQVNKREA